MHDLSMLYCPYKNYIVFVTLNSTDKHNNLEMSFLLILLIATPLVKYKINASQLTITFVCRSKRICSCTCSPCCCCLPTPPCSLGVVRSCCFMGFRRQLLPPVI